MEYRKFGEMNLYIYLFRITIWVSHLVDFIASLEHTKNRPVSLLI